MVEAVEASQRMAIDNGKECQQGTGFPGCRCFDLISIPPGVLAALGFARGIHPLAQAEAEPQAAQHLKHECMKDGDGKMHL